VENIGMSKGGIEGEARINSDRYYSNNLLL
jgi:hypothetical protein